MRHERCCALYARVVDDEQRTIEAFVVASRRDRWTAGLANTKHRRKIVRRLCHEDDWLDKYATTTKPTGMRHEQLSALLGELRRLGAPADCHVVAESPAHDGRSMPLVDALEEFIDDGCALIICVPGALAVHLPEAPAAPVILSRRDV
jgi:hypothetical protein